MTEKEGGSDVGTLTTTSRAGRRPLAALWREMVLLQCRRQGGDAAGASGRGGAGHARRRAVPDAALPRRRLAKPLPDRSAEGQARHPLDGLGRDQARGAIAYAVGKLDRGFVQMAEMVNSSRLSNGVKSTALMRRAHHDAMTVARNRVVFGRRIIDLPLARRQLMKIMLPTEQALSMSFLTADALDRAEAGSQDAAALLRISTPTLKFRATRDARKVCGDALEMRGGIGYIEEFATAAAAARCASRLDLGRHRQYRRDRCADARGRPPRRRCCAGGGPARPPRRQRQRAAGLAQSPA